MNAIKTGFLLAALTLLLLFGGQMIHGQQGLTIALLMAVVMNFAAYFWSDKIALAMSGARPVTPAEAPRMYRITEGLCARAALPSLLAAGFTKHRQPSIEFHSLAHGSWQNGAGVTKKKPIIRIRASQGDRDV